MTTIIEINGTKYAPAPVPEFYPSALLENGIAPADVRKTITDLLTGSKGAHPEVLAAQIADYVNGVTDEVRSAAEAEHTPDHTIKIKYPEDPVKVYRDKQKDRNDGFTHDEHTLSAEYLVHVVLDGTEVELRLEMDFERSRRNNNYSRVDPYAWERSRAFALAPIPQGEYAWPRKDYKTQQFEHRAAEAAQVFFEYTNVPVPVAQLSKLHNERVEEKITRQRKKLAEAEALIMPLDDPAYGED